MKKYLLYIIITTTSVVGLFSQDVNFSLFYLSPVYLNPANSGNFDGKWRLYTNYRHQGDFIDNSYNTNILTFDIPLFYSDYSTGLSFSAISDQTSNYSLFSNEFNISSAHFVKISSFSYLHIGLGFSIVNKYISNKNFSFPNQFDNSTGSFNPNFENNELFNDYSKWYFDLSWGIMYSRIKETFKLQLAIAMFHYNKPNFDFYNSDNEILPRFQFHSYVQKDFKNNLFLKPKFLFSYQMKASEIIIGSDLGISFENEYFSKIYCGLFLRSGLDTNPDSYIINLGFTYKHFNFNFNFDFPITNLNLTKSDQTFEISIFYTLPRLKNTSRAIQCEIL